MAAMNLDLENLLTSPKPSQFFNVAPKPSQALFYAF